jgi:hypothetical protein
LISREVSVRRQLKGRRLSDDERQAIEQRMWDEGRL